MLTSRWEEWGPISVAHIGIGGYLSMISAAILAGIVRLPVLRITLWSLMIVESLTGIGFIAWLLFLQWIIIKQFCVFCLSSHFFGALAYGVVLLRAPAWNGFHHARRRLTGASALLLTLLVAVHIFVVPEMMAIQPADNITTIEEEEAAALSTGMLQFGKTAPSRTVQLLDGNLTFDLYEVPVSGNRDAEHVLVELSDYCCPSCRSLHRRLAQFEKDYEVDMVIVHLPAPMDTDCNPHITRTPRGFDKACEYARLAMAVNQVDPTQFAAFHHALMADRFPPGIEEAREKAEALVDKDALALAMESEAVTAWIRNGLNLKRYLKATTLPKLITDTQVISYSGGSKGAFRETMKEALVLQELKKR